MLRLTLLSFILLASYICQAESVHTNKNITLYEKLCDVNKQWLKKDFDDPVLKEYIVFESDVDLIQKHLELVVQKLRETDVTHLNKLQAKNRSRYLNILSEYGKAGQFPINSYHQKRTPYFIDDYGTACAVGYLVLQSDYKAVSHQIADENNYAYVHDLLGYADLITWATEAGFTVDELAWIQPGYATPPTETWESLGTGTNGTVYDMEVNSTNNTVIIVGEFTIANGINNVGSIVVYDGSNWQKMSDGVNGKINDVLIDDNGTIYIGGEFTVSSNSIIKNVAVWDGTNWQTIGNGMPYGEVFKMIVYNGDLYLGGSFVYGINPNITQGLFKLDNDLWDIPNFQTDGPVYELYENDGKLYFGGEFESAGATPAKNIAVLENDVVSAFDTTGNGYPAFPVKTIYKIDTNLYVGGLISPDPNSTWGGYIGLSSWGGNAWVDWMDEMSFWWDSSDTPQITEISEIDGGLVISGEFKFVPMYGTYGVNLMRIDSMYSANGIIDSINGNIQCMVHYQDKFIIGGAFTVAKGGSANRLTYTDANLIPSAIPRVKLKQLNIYPNVTNTSATIDFGEFISTATIEIFNISGRLVDSKLVENRESIILNSTDYAKGLYIIQLRNGNAPVARGKVIFK